MLEWREEGKAEIAPGVLFIDEVHMLDLECFSFLNRALEDPMAPLVIMATNRGDTRVRGTDYYGFHGLPMDTLDRCLIITTVPYTKAQLAEILRLRAEAEDIELEADTLAMLTEVAADTSLRYAMQLIMTSALVAFKRKAAKVGTEDVARCYRLFLDMKRSTDYLKEYDDQVIFSSEKDLYESTLPKGRKSPADEAEGSTDNGGDVTMQ